MKISKEFFSTISEILKYGGSTFAALVAVCIYTLTDEFFIGHWVGTKGLAAMALVFPVTMIFTAMSTLVEIGGSAVVSEKIGSGNRELAEKIMRANYVYAFVVGIFFAVVGNIFVEPLMRFLADSPHEHQIVDMAIVFLRISFCGVPFLLTGYLTETFMRCIEKPVHVFWMMAGTAATNILLDVLFVVVLDWGVTGAAIATLIAQALGAVISLWYFKFSRQKFLSSWGVCGINYLWQECKIGAGFAIADLMMFFVEYFLNGVLLHYNSPHLLAAASVVNVVLSFAYLPLSGLDSGIQPLVSRLFANDNEQQYLRVMRYGFFLTMFLTFVIYALLMLFTEELLDSFVSDDEPVTPDMVNFLLMAVILQPFAGIYTWLSGLMAALEDEWRNLLISFLPLVVQLPLIWFLPKVLPLEYVALNFAALDVAEALVAFVLIRSFLRKEGLSFKKIFNGR